MNPQLLNDQKFNSLEHLRAYHSERFIRLAYQFILGREADEEGLHHYRLLFQQDLMPSEFLTALRTSPEAQSRILKNRDKTIEFSDAKFDIRSAHLNNSINQQTYTTHLVHEIAIDKALEKMPNLLTIEDLIKISKNID